MEYNSNNLQLDQFVQQHLLSNNVSANVSKNTSPVRGYHPLMKSPLYSNNLQHIENNNNRSQTPLDKTQLLSTNQSPQNENKSSKNNQENQHHFYSMNDKSLDILMQSPTKNNDKQTVYQSFTHSPSPPNKNQIRSQLEDTSSFHNNIINQEQQNDSFCSSPQRIQKHKEDSPVKQQGISPYKRSPRKTQRIINDENSFEISLQQSPSFQKQQQFQQQNNDSKIEMQQLTEVSLPIVNNRKSVVLEQENQELKNQIEMLKAALLGLCNKQQIQVDVIPQEVIPLISNKFKENHIQETLQDSQLNNQSKDQDLQQNVGVIDKSDLSNKNSQNQVETSCANTNKINQEVYESQTSLNSSPSKSTKRRKRCQRQKSPLKQTQVPSQGMVVEQTKGKSREKRSPSFIEDLPLQMQYRKKTTNDSNIDKQQQQKESCDQQEESHETYQHNEDSILMGSQIQILNNITGNQVQISSSTENDIEVNDISMRGDQSQIQLKYLRMLEELENESLLAISQNNINDYSQGSPVRNDIVETKDTATFREGNEAFLDQAATKTVDVEKQRKSKESIEEQQDNLIMPKGRFMETLRSNKFEYEQFYENELHQLKNELELFEQEEEQILKMFQNPTQSPDKIVEQIDLESPQKVDLQNIDQNGSILNNLREAFLELQDVLEDQQEDDLIRPVKILSPLQYVETINSEMQFGNTLTNQESMISPVKYPITSQSVISGGDKNYAGQSVINSNIKQTPLIERSLKMSQLSREYSNFKSSQKSLHNQYYPASNSTYKPKNQSCVKIEKRHPSQLTKSPSQVSLQNCRQLADNENQNRSITPTKTGRLRSESRLRMQQQSAINKYKMSTNKNDDDLGVVQVPNVETIELLAKRKSLAFGLKQQEEPISSDEEKELDQVMRNSSHIGLRIIKPILMEHPTFDNNCNNLISEPDEVRIEIINDDTKCNQNNPQTPSLNYQSYFDGDMSTGLIREKQSVEGFLEETKQHVKSTHDKFFGLYSKEKSDLLKSQRAESIKRAEQMLSTLIKDKNFDSKRPSYMGSPKKDNIKETCLQTPTNFIVSENRENLMQVTQNSEEFNDLSFQVQKLEDYKLIQNQFPNHCSKLRESTRDSLISNENNLDVINLQISPSRYSIQPNQEQYDINYHNEISNHVSPNTLNDNLIDLKLQQFDAFEQCITGSESKVLNVNNQQQQHKKPFYIDDDDNQDSSQDQCEYFQQNFHQGVVVNQTPKNNNFDQTCIQSQFSQLKKEYQMFSPFSNQSNIGMLEPQIINRRKSLESTVTPNSKMYQANQQSNPKRRTTLHLKKGGAINSHAIVKSAQKQTHQTIDHSSNYNSKSEINQTIVSQSSNNYYNQQNATNNQSNFGSFQSSSVDKIKKKQKTLALSKTVENLNKHEINQSSRSKSVVKRREELLKKKQIEMQTKLEAKNMRIESFKNTRNSQLNTSNGRCQSNQKYSNGGNNASGVNNNQSEGSYECTKIIPNSQQVQYHSKQKSIECNSRSMTPIKGNQLDKSQRVSHIGAAKQYETITHQSQPRQQLQQQQSLTKSKSQSKCQIKFEKRPSNMQNNPLIVTSNQQNHNLYNQTAIFNLHTPSSNAEYQNIKELQQINPGSISAKNVQNISIIPSTLQSGKTNNTKCLASESSSYRRLSNTSNNMNCGVSSSQSNSDFNETYYQPTAFLNINQSEKQISSITLQNRKQSIGNNQSSNLKQNIVNRTMRIGQQKPKEYLQLKQEQKQRQTMLNTLEISNNCSQAKIGNKHQANNGTIQGSTLNQTIHSSSSMIINSKQQSNTNISSLHAINNKAKALTKSFLQKDKQLCNSKSTQKLNTVANIQHLGHSSNNSSSVVSSGYNTQQQKQSSQNGCINIRPVTVIDYSEQKASNNHFTNQHNSNNILFSDKKSGNQQKSQQRYYTPLEEEIQTKLNSKFDEYQRQDFIKSAVSDRKECQNCMRLISKGLSTDFCLEHYGTPRCIDD
eukprot:403331198